MLETCILTEVRHLGSALAGHLVAGSICVITISGLVGWDSQCHGRLRTHEAEN
jgi:hypothetical protein